MKIYEVREILEAEGKTTKEINIALEALFSPPIPKGKRVDVIEEVTTFKPRIKMVDGEAWVIHDKPSKYKGGKNKKSSSFAYDRYNYFGA